MTLLQKSAWQALERHHKEIETTTLRHLFESDPHRGERYSTEACGLYLDYSKNRITDTTLSLFEELLQQIDFDGARNRQFSGEKINSTEGRAVLHTALRNRSGSPVLVDGRNVMEDVERELQKMERFCKRVHSGEWLGHSGKPIRHVVNIGIGGSDLGPAMVVEALKPFHIENGPKLHFVSNVDGADLDDTLNKVSLDETLFLIASKTFTTSETMTNAFLARQKLLEQYGGESVAVRHHFVALSTNSSEVSAFGIDPQNMFLFWDWVGGRYSLWSAIGLSIALAVGFDNFQLLLEGAHQMDRHFQTAPVRENLPLLMGLLSVWYNNFWGYNSHAVIPYHHHLRRFPAYLQQLDMESNGKRVTLSGEAVSTATGPIVWGDVGSNAQHAFFQLLHQGSQIVPCDLIVAAKAHHPHLDHQQKLLANCLAQSQALMQGKTESQVRLELQKSGLNSAEIDTLAPHKVFEGNRPTNTLMVERLTPQTLGSLIALYEQRTFVQGVVWGINSFDQYGVELGKELAGGVLQKIVAPLPEAATLPLESSTDALLKKLRLWG